jgi:hypothetical protein
LFTGISFKKAGDLDVFSTVGVTENTLNFFTEEKVTYDLRGPVDIAKYFFRQVQ